MSSNEDVPHPPRAPEIRRRLRLDPLQWIGMSVLLLVPILALAGILGETRETVAARTASLAVDLQYPTRSRYAMLAQFDLQVTNIGPTSFDTVTVAFDTAYLARFSEPLAIPAFEHPYVVELIGLEAGETRRVTVEVRGDEYGRHGGEVRIGAGEAELARIPLATFVFP